MNSKTTWTYTTIAAVLLAFIVFVEHPFRKKLNAARSTIIFPTFKAASVNRVEVRRTGELILAVRTNGSWQLASPLPYPAADSEIEKLLQAIAELNWQTQITAAELKDRPKAQEEFGFAAPTASLTVQQGDATLNLLVGTNTPVGEQVFVQVVGSAGVYVIDSEFLKLLPRAASDWRDPYLFRFSGPINSIKSRSGNKTLTLTHTNNSWRLPQARADNEKISRLLEKTAEIKIAKFETDDPQAPLEPYGLQAPEMELVFAFDTNVLATLQVGKSPTNDPTLVFARIENHVVRIGADALAEWRGSHTNFIDSRLLNLSPKEVTRIDVRDGAPFSLQRENDGSWKLAGAPEFPVDAELVGEVLTLLGNARVTIEKDVVTDFASYGLEPPALEYSLTARGPTNSAVAQIHFGTNQPGKVFTRRLDEYPDTVNSIHPEEYNYLPQAAWQFQDRRIWSFASNEVVSVTVQQKGKERKIIRNAKGDWSLAPGSQGVFNPFALEEALFRLGDLKAVFWVSPDEKNPERFGFKQADHRISIEVQRGGKIETLALEFGDYSEFGTRYTVLMSNGARKIFEFPWPLFFAVQEVLSISK